MAKTKARYFAKKRMRVAAKRIKRREEKQRLKERKLIGELIGKLTEYMALHYGNPVTGREGTILDGPVIARLSAAASLRAALLTTSYEKRMIELGKRVVVRNSKRRKAKAR
jgi:hypothetical protein